MRCFQFRDYGEPLEERLVADPTPTGSEVLLAIRACGVCHSDVHVHDGYFDLGDGRKLNLAGGRELPFTLGHEIAGTVLAAGDEARGVAPGDEVVVYPWIGCGDCAMCAAGDEHLCQDARALGIQQPGGYADRILVPDPRYLFEYAPLAPELAATYACSGLTAYSAVQRIAAHGVSGPLLIIGAGGVGLAALAAARAVLEAPIVVADRSRERLALAEAAGAHSVLHTEAGQGARELRRLSSGGPAGILDFVGSESTVGLAVSAVRKGGIVVVVGLFGGSLALSLPLLPLKAFTLAGSYVGSLAEMAELMSLARSGRLAPIPVGSRPLGQAQAALSDLRAGRVDGRIVLCP